MLRCSITCFLVWSDAGCLKTAGSDIMHYAWCCVITLDWLCASLLPARCTEYEPQWAAAAPSDIALPQRPIKRRNDLTPVRLNDDKKPTGPNTIEGYAAWWAQSMSRDLRESCLALSVARWLHDSNGMHHGKAEMDASRWYRWSLMRLSKREDDYLNEKENRPPFIRCLPSNWKRVQFHTLSVYGSGMAVFNGANTPDPCLYCWWCHFEWELADQEIYQQMTDKSGRYQPKRLNRCRNLLCTAFLLLIWQEQNVDKIKWKNILIYQNEAMTSAHKVAWSIAFAPFVVQGGSRPANHFPD